MAAPVKKNFKIYQGSTFNEILRWESSTKVYKPITAITKAAPMVVTAVGHGLIVGWRAWISNVAGMKEANSDLPITATEVSTDTVTFNSVNAAGYTTYTSGGILEYNMPVPLAGYTARMHIRPSVNSSTLILELTTANSMLVIDDATKTITINIPATTTELFTFKSAVYSLELVSGATVLPFIYGSLTLDVEVTR